MLTQKLLILIFKEERRLAARQKIHRNMKKVSQIPCYSKTRCLVQTCEKKKPSDTTGAAIGFFSNLRTAAISEIVCELIDWQPDTEIMIKEPDINTFEAAMCFKILESPIYKQFMVDVSKYDAGVKDLDWVRLHGKYALDNEQYCLQTTKYYYYSIKHKNLNVSMPLPLGMRVEKSLTFEKAGVPAECRLETTIRVLPRR